MSRNGQSNIKWKIATHGWFN